MKWCVYFPFHVYRLIQQNNLLFRLTFVHFDIILPERQRETLGHHWLLDPEIRGFQDVLAGFILDEVLSKKGIFSGLRTKQYKA
jgi:hypothetical protein